MATLFPLGQVVATPAALELMASFDGLMTGNVLLKRHAAGDWGDVCKEDAGMNDEALKSGDRILSVYKFDRATFWIITESDRSVTTLLTPECY